MPITTDAGISRLHHPGIDLPSDRVGASQVPLDNAGGIREKGSAPGLGRFPGGGHANPLQ